jgi:adenosylcobyric acid synthase (glutamine-hydrolysing) (EC 6.3.5.10)
LDTTLDQFDAVVLPGSKNTVDDLLALQEAGFDDELATFDGPIVGICGGYQMLGEHIAAAGIESTAVEGTVPALGQLPVRTTFSAEKEVSRTTCSVDGMGPIAGADGTASGYEIHMGDTRYDEDLAHPLEPTSACEETVLGTYLHGLFENEGVRDAFVATLFERAEVERPTGAGEIKEPSERAASLLDAHLDLTAVDALARSRTSD